MPKKPAGSSLSAGRESPPGLKFFGYLFTKRRIHAGGKEGVVDNAATVIIPVVQLAFYPDVGAKAGAALSAPFTFKHRHCC
jgi:hypothetical protein